MNDSRENCRNAQTAMHAFTFGNEISPDLIQSDPNLEICDWKVSHFVFTVLLVRERYAQTPLKLCWSKNVELNKLRHLQVVLKREISIFHRVKHTLYYFEIGCWRKDHHWWLFFAYVWFIVCTNWVTGNAPNYMLHTHFSTLVISKAGSSKSF